jgi:tetratricopeptide (TPR) repeat protein
MPDSTENLTDSSAIIRDLIEAGATLEALGHHDEALAAYTEVDTRFSDDADADVAELVAIALLRRGQMLSKLRRREESIAVFEDIVSRFQGAEDPRFRIRVAQSHFRSGRDLRSDHREVCERRGI